MNKRHRAILSALQPATDAALKVSAKRDRNTRPAGLILNKRISADAAAEIYVYGEIGGGGWFDDGISATDVQYVLADAGPGPVNVRINSGGGDVFQGVAIHTLLARHPGVVTAYVDGLAASAASFIMLAADHIVAARNSFIMIHKAATGTYGDDEDHHRNGDLLSKVSGSIADMYSERAGEDPAFWLNAMTQNGLDGTWYTGQEALTAGLVDALTETPDDFDEDRAVSGRLLAWHAMLPVQAREFVSDHPVEETDDDEDEPADEIPAGAGGGAPDTAAPAGPDPEVTDDADRDWAFALLAAGMK